MKLSIVTTLYHSAPYIDEFYRRISESAQRVTEDYEIIFVNDGSPDNSLDLAVRIHVGDRRIRVLDLSRNFGHHKAIMTGLAHARGERVFLLDCDLEEEPELLERFWKEMDASQDVDVVYGVQEIRKGNWFERISGKLFYWAFNQFASIKLPENLATVRLMTLRYVKALISFREQEIFLAGLWAATGFTQKPVSFRKLDHSPSTYSLRKKLSILVNSITSFSNKPLISIFYLGTIMTLFSFIFVLYMIYRKVMWGIDIEGWLTLVVSIWLIGGVTIFSIGIVGIYLSKIFVESKRRPYTIVRRQYGKYEGPTQKH